MRRKARAAAVAFAVVGFPLPLRAAEGSVSPLKAGDRIRVSAPAFGKATTGRLLEVGPDVLKIQLTDRRDPVEMPRASLTSLERSLGRHSSVGKGALVGALVGAGLGIAVATKSYAGEDCDGSCTPYAVVVGAACVGAGSLLGVIGGALIKTEQWETIPARRIGLSVAPRPRGAAVALQVRF
jgi:hypothetical protein